MIVIRHRHRPPRSLHDVSRAWVSDHFASFISVQAGIYTITTILYIKGGLSRTRGGGDTVVVVVVVVGAPLGR